MDNIQQKQGDSTISRAVLEAPKMTYCLYARKSTESDEKQALSIDSQVKEMLRVAERDGLEVIDIRRESHSAKDSGQRPVFAEILTDLRGRRFNGILTWAPDRLSRNAGDLGSLVDLMDQKLLVEIQTFGQKFTNSPSEKFLLMILCSQAKLENDNKSINVKRGLRMRCEMGLWPAPAPTGYLNEKRIDRKGYVMIDPERGPIVRQIFEKVAYEKISRLLRGHQKAMGKTNWPKGSKNMKRERNKEAILKQLQKIPVVEVACQRAGISRATYYRWRKENHGFRKAADEATIEGELLVNDMSESQIISLIREKNWSAISFWLRHHHPKYANKLEINANINPVEQLTPEQEAIIKEALKLASLPEVNELDDKNHGSGENSNQTSE